MPQPAISHCNAQGEARHTPHLAGVKVQHANSQHNPPHEALGHKCTCSHRVGMLQRSLYCVVVGFETFRAWGSGSKCRLTLHLSGCSVTAISLYLRFRVRTSTPALTCRMKRASPAQGQQKGSPLLRRSWQAYASPHLHGHEQPWLQPVAGRINVYVYARLDLHR